MATSQKAAKKTQKRTKQSTLFHAWAHNEEDNKKAEEIAAQEVMALGMDKTSLMDFFEDDLAKENDGRDTHASNRQACSSNTRLNASLHNSSLYEEIPGFDTDAGTEYIYPTNYPIRDYQYNIVKKCLFKNTLVSLPTGLGKTFIAAVVMYNFYRWYPQSKVVFMAPTKPLVAQQIEACYNIMGTLWVEPTSPTSMPNIMYTH